MSIINSVWGKIWFMINEPSKTQFCNFCLFIFLNFKRLLSKIFQKTILFLLRISRLLMRLYYVINISDLHIFDDETTALLKIFENCTEMHFASLFFLNERNITTTYDRFKMYCCALCSSKFKLHKQVVLDYGPLNTLFDFIFYFLFMFILTRLL